MASQLHTSTAELGHNDTSKPEYDTSHIEEKTAHDASAQWREHALQTLPASLREMSTEERTALEKKMVRKVDFVILPIIGILYILNNIDRQNLAAAKLQGIMTDLKMSSDQFATAISLLYVGYLPFQIPSNLLITRIPRPGLYICSATVLWGIVSATTAAVQTYQALWAVRVFLGVTEAVFFPGVIYFLSAWYTKQELGKRLSAFFISQNLGNGFGGLLAAGILKLDGKRGIAGWRWLFIVEGAATVFAGLTCAYFLPEFPHNARILTPVERDLAVWRIEQEAGAGEAHEEISTLKSFRMAVTDGKLWALVFCMMMSQGMGSVNNFFPTIVSSLGYNTTITLLLTAPPYVFACFFFFATTYISDRKNTIYPIIMFCLALSTVIYVIPLATLNLGARYFSMMILPSVGIGPQIFIYKTLNLHLARPYPKRAAGSALINAIGGTSNTWASFLYRDAPHFYLAFGCLLGFTTLFAADITLYRFFVRSENKKLERGNPEEIRKVMKRGVTQEQVDMGWRYEGF